MGFRFRKSFKIAPGVKLNLNKKSTGLTFGGKGVHYTVNSKGKRTTSVGIPGTGLYYTSNSSGSKKKKSHDVKNSNPVESTKKEIKIMDKKWYQKTWFTILMLICFFPVGLFLMWKYTSWSKVAKIIITVVLALFCIIAAAGGSEEEETPEEGIVTTTEASAIIEEQKTPEVVSQTEAASKETETTTESETTTKEETTTAPETTTKEETTTKDVTTTQPETTTQQQAEMVWIPANGKRYHCKPDCSGLKNPKQCTIEEAERKGLTPCSNCY